MTIQYYNPIQYYNSILLTQLNNTYINFNEFLIYANCHSFSLKICGIFLLRAIYETIVHNGKKAKMILISPSHGAVYKHFRINL